MVIRLKVPTEMHYTAIPTGTSKVNSSRFTVTLTSIHDYSIQFRFTEFVSTRLLYCTKVFTGVLYCLSSYLVGKWHKEAFSRKRRSANRVYHGNENMQSTVWLRRYDTIRKVRVSLRLELESYININSLQHLL